MRLLKTKLLFSLASELDFHAKTEGFEYQRYEFLYFRLSEYELGSIRDSAVRLTRAGFVDKLIRNDKAWLRLTALGREQLLRQLGIYRRQSQPWDNRWRLVIVLSGRGQARELGTRLKQLGYKRVTRGVYVTPFKVSEATRELFLEPKWQKTSFVIESRRLVVGDNLELSRNLWNLEVLGTKYADFVSLASRLLRLARKNIVLLQQSKGGFKTVLDRYFQLCLLDPGLPKQLLPLQWPADAAKELFLRLATLAKTAAI